MTEIGFRYAVCALRAKRSEIAGEIERLRLETAQHRRDLTKVDDILRILAPGSDPTQIPARKAIKSLNVFRQGQLNALILGVLKAAGRPLTNIQVLEALMANLGAQAGARDALRRRVNANLPYLRDTNRVVKLATGLRCCFALLSDAPPLFQSLPMPLL